MSERTPVDFLAVVIPAYNASLHIARVLERLSPLHPADRTWVIDDGSTDDTGAVARRCGAHVVTHAPNRGKGAALLTGFTAACAAGADAVATIDADEQHKPEDLPRMVAGLAGADLVVGARVRTGRMPPHRRLGNALSAGFLTWLAGTPLPDVQSGYRIHRRVALEALGLVGEGAPGRTRRPPAFRSTGYGFESEILVAAARLGFTIANVPIEAVYDGAPSHLNPAREVPKFVSLYARLLADASRWSAYRAHLESLEGTA